MIGSRGTDALIALEDAAPPILFETFPKSDMQIWPLLRWPVARSLAEVELNKHAVPRVVTRMQTVERALKRLLPNPYGPARIRNTADILFVVSGSTVSRSPEGLKNWLVEDHARTLGAQALVLQDRAIDSSTPAHLMPTFVNTFSFEDSAVRAEAAAKFFAPSKSELAHSHEFVQEIFNVLEFDVDPARVREAGRQLEVRYRRARHTARLFEHVLDRVRPKILFMQTASYGDRSHLISMAKNHGITVAEHQHGWIGPSHGAYNFGAAMWSQELSRCLPDFLLTYGDFWSSQVRTPSELVSVGKPHLEAMAAKSPPYSARNKDIVIVSGMYEPEETARFTIAVRDALPNDWRVVFRPHPTERAAVRERFPTLVNQSRIVIDEKEDVFETLKQARGVVGHASTVLYEALALDCVVFVKDSPLADLYVDESIFGARITDDKSLRRAMNELVQSTGGSNTTDLGPIWHANSTEKFARFVEEVIGAR